MEWFMELTNVIYLYEVYVKLKLSLSPPTSALGTFLHRQADLLSQKFDWANLCVHYMPAWEFFPPINFNEA